MLPPEINRPGKHPRYALVKGVILSDRPNETQETIHQWLEHEMLWLQTGVTATAPQPLSSVSILARGVQEKWRE